MKKKFTAAAPHTKKSISMNKRLILIKVLTASTGHPDDHLLGTIDKIYTCKSKTHSHKHTKYI